MSYPGYGFPPPSYGAPPFGGSPLTIEQEKTNSYNEGGVPHTQYTVTVRNLSGQPLTGYTLRLSAPVKEVWSMITGPDGVTLSFPSHVATLNSGDVHKWGFTAITPPPHTVTAVPPGYGAPVPGYGAPGYGAPTPTPQPPYGFPPAPGFPGYGAPAPYGAPTPTPQPPYGFPPAPGFGAPTPGYGAPAPGFPPGYRR